MGLRVRLIVMLLVPLVLAVALLGRVRISQEEAWLLEAARRDLSHVAGAVRIALEATLSQRGMDDLHRLLFEMTLNHDAIAQIRLLDSEGTILLASGRVALPGVGVEDVTRTFRTGQSELVETWVEGRRVMYRLLPVRTANRTVAVAEVAAVADHVETALWWAAFDVWIRLALVTLVVAGTMLFVLQHEVFRPLGRLLRGIRRLGRGQPALPLPVDRRDELGRLAEAFNEMTAQLEAARKRLLAETERALDLEQQLRRTQTLAVAGKLASSVAHEIGTPLTIASGRAEVLLATLPADHPSRSDLSGIVDQIERVSAIIETLLDVVRPQKPQPEALTLEKVLDGLWPLIEHQGRRDGVTLGARVPGDLPPVAADGGQMQQVLINVLMNALEATPPGGLVTLGADRCRNGERDGVAITVTDTGAGMSAETLARAFEPFFTTKPPGRGTGLGLAISRDIVREHGGEITLESTEGAGTTVTIWLPAAEGRA